jgi:hypothetical protein
MIKVHEGLIRRYESLADSYRKKGDRATARQFEAMAREEIHNHALMWKMNQRLAKRK